jgi:uncharacterized repeat protein (TIGR01451 family)
MNKQLCAALLTVILLLALLVLGVSSIQAMVQARSTLAWSDVTEIPRSEYTAPVTGTLPILEITKSGPAWAEPGEPITYTLTVRNNSTTPIASLDVTDTVPSGATYLGGGTLIVDVVVWSVPSLEPASAISFQFSVTATQTITNSIYRVTAASRDFAAGSQPVVTHIGDICSSVTEIPQSECEALVALYSNTNGPNWTNNTGWLASNTPCGDDMFELGWTGVSCTNGHVISLSLSYNPLSGPIPPEIGNLTALEQLWLDTNQLTGSIPPEIGSLTELSDIRLFSNQLSGTIPPQIGSLTALEQLWLSGNQMSGPIPPEISSLTALQVLILEGNQLSGAIPPEIGDLLVGRLVCHFP